MEIDTSGIASLEELQKHLDSKGIKVKASANNPVISEVSTFNTVSLFLSLSLSVGHSQSQMESHSQAKACQLCWQNWRKGFPDCWRSHACRSEINYKPSQANNASFKIRSM